MSEKRFVAHDTLVEDFVESLESKNAKEKTKPEGKLLEEFLRNKKNDERQLHRIKRVTCVQYLRTRWFVSEISLVRCAHSFYFRYLTNSFVNTVRIHFP